MFSEKLNYTTAASEAWAEPTVTSVFLQQDVAVHISWANQVTHGCQVSCDRLAEKFYFLSVWAFPVWGRAERRGTRGRPPWALGAPAGPADAIGLSLGPWKVVWGRRRPAGRDPFSQLPCG